MKFIEKSVPTVSTIGTNEIMCTLSGPSAMMVAIAALERGYKKVQTLVATLQSINSGIIWSFRHNTFSITVTVIEINPNSNSSKGYQQ